MQALAIAAVAELNAPCEPAEGRAGLLRGILFGVAIQTAALGAALSGFLCLRHL